MAGYLTPIIDEIVTILQANLPGEIDDLDTDLDDVPNQFMHKAMMQFQLQYPAIEVFAEESVLNPNYTHGTIDIDWRIVTAISFSAKDEETGMSEMSTYMTAIIKSIEKGTTANNEMKLNGVVRYAGPIAVNFVNGGVSGNILFSLFIIWQMVKSEDTLAGV